MDSKEKPTTIRRDDPEVTDQPGTFTLVNQAEAIIENERKAHEDKETPENS